VATIAGVDLCLGETQYAAGGAFRVSLSTPAKDPDVVSVEFDGHTVEVHPEARQAIVRSARLPTGDVADHVHEVAQRGLDIIAFQGRGAATMPRGHEEHLLWWRDPAGTALRLVVRHHFGVAVSAEARVIGPDGREKPPDPVPPPRWIPGLRYFRLSQTADDVFDAYRNTFLALEAILAELVPGGPRGERAGLKHALQDVESRGLVIVGDYVAAGQRTPLNAFLDDQYTALRCATFHAKQRPRSLLPGSLQDRQTVAAALEPLTRLVLSLGRSATDLTFRSGGMTAIGFEMMIIAPMSDRLGLAVARDDTPVRRDQTFSDLGALPMLDLASRYLGRLDAHGLEQGFLGKADSAEFLRVPFNSVVAHVDEELLSRHTVPLIDPDGVDRLEVVYVYGLENRRTPRTSFSL
jgi:hypothetical protein